MTRGDWLWVSGYGACALVALVYFVHKSILGARNLRLRWHAFWRKFSKLFAGNNA